MSRLKARLDGSAKATTKGVVRFGRLPGEPTGITLADGTHYALDGQPPPAPVGSWGNLAFLYLGRRR